MPKNTQIPKSDRKLRSAGPANSAISGSVSNRLRSAFTRRPRTSRASDSNRKPKIAVHQAEPSQASSDDLITVPEDVENPEDNEHPSPTAEASIVAPGLTNAPSQNSSHGIHWQRLREMVEAFMSQDAAAAKRADTETKIETLKESIAKMRNAVISFASCWMCGKLMDFAFTLSCGHAFCSSCLCAHFEHKLRVKLGVHTTIHQLPPNTFEIPSSRQELLHLADQLASNTIDPEATFSYSCPSEICPHIIDQSPVLAFQHSEINLLMVDVFQNLTPSVQLPFATSALPDAFDRLFLRT